ncbi:B-cell antigen receptor complex-associated protein alpha chain [Eucyclogobius newberryi]|uniref:B-cell antigen receptor complex-associated protein alpha chain n=1 Tax=Eucyclogobius newberryi TaxID=166745 RepID=UPI003B596251
MLVLLVCSFYVLCVQCKVTLRADRPSFKVEVSEPATLECCFTTSENQDFLWIKSSQQHAKKTVQTSPLHDAVTKRQSFGNGGNCGVLILRSATLNDTGFYRCFLNGSKVFTHGTYLQVYKSLEKTIKLSESVKNGILIAEGILLLLCVVLPSASLLFKSKNLHELEKKKMQKEEENIYQGLNLDDCYAAYDQIEHLQGQGPYEDVANIEEDIQLEKP